MISNKEWEMPITFDPIVSLFDEKNEEEQSNPPLEEQCNNHATRLFEELTNHYEMKTVGFKFTFIKEPGFYCESIYKIICTPPVCGSFITNHPFVCEIVNDKIWYEKGKDDIVTEISLGAIDNKYYDGSLVYMGTEYMGYERKIFKTNREVIEQFEKILASKEIILAFNQKSKIMETELHEKSGCCFHSESENLGKTCYLFSRTGYKMSYFVEAYGHWHGQSLDQDGEKIIKAIKKALTGYSLTRELSSICGLPTPLGLIIREYFETYSDVLTIRFGKAINTMIILNNGNLALAFDNGVVGIYDVITKTMTLNKTCKNTSVSLCQFDDNTLVCGFSDLDKLMMWNFKSNANNMINLPSSRQIPKRYCKKNSIILFGKKILMLNLTDDNIYTIDFNHEKTKIKKVDFNTNCFLRDNNLMFIGYKNIQEENVYAKSIVSVFNVKDYIEANLNGGCTSIFALDWNIEQFEPISKNKFLCLTWIYDGHCCSFFSNIYILNIKTGDHTLLINEYECDKIISIAYLGNNHLALHRYNRIEIINIKTKKMIQQINTDNKMTFMIKLNNINDISKLIVVDSTDYPVPRKAKNKSCVRIYHKIG